MIRSLFLIIIVGIGAAFIGYFYHYNPTTPLEYTFTPAYELLGRSTKAFDRVLSKVIPVNSVDERQYGDAIARRFQSRIKESAEQDYLNDLMKNISAFAKKPFQYRVYIIDYQTPNAFAMPGGIIFISRGLLQVVQSEAELVYILAHEMGHIELSHCFDSVRFELLAKKVHAEMLGKIADFTMTFFLRHSFSKTMENEADAYAYALLINTRYDPSAAGMSFESLLNYRTAYMYKGAGAADPIKEYFQTHPYTELRKETYIETARQWWASHPGEARYRGKLNLQRRSSFYKSQISSEWISGMDR